MSSKLTENRLLVCMTATPWAWLVALYGLALLTTLRVGHFPTQGKPDPKFVAIPFVYDGVLIAAALTVAGFVTWLLFAPVFARRLGVRTVAWHGLFVLAALGLTTWQWYGDPFGLVGWYCD